MNLYPLSVSRPAHVISSDFNALASVSMTVGAGKDVLDASATSAPVPSTLEHAQHEYRQSFFFGQFSTENHTIRLGRGSDRLVSDRTPKTSRNSGGAAPT